MMGSDGRLAIMRELHDTVTHCLSTVALQVMVAETQPSGAHRNSAPHPRGVDCIGTRRKVVTVS